MKTQVKEITPQWAEKVLKENNTHNRRLNENRVGTIAADMVAGCFVLTHQGIAFAEDGTLIDGQHRLAAVVQSGVSVQMLVTTGLPRSHQDGVSLDTIDVIDCGGLRTVGQQLSLAHGIQDANHVAAAIKMVAMICLPGKLYKLTTAQTLKILDEYSQHVEAVLNTKYSRALGRAGVYGTLVFCRPARTEAVDDFISKYCTLEQIPQNSPISALRRKMLGVTGATSNTQALDVARDTATAVMKHCEGQKMSLVRTCEDGLRYFRGLQKSRVKMVTDIVSPSK